LFSNINGIYIDANCSPPHAALEELVTLCGGKVSEYSPPHAALEELVTLCGGKVSECSP